MAKSNLILQQTLKLDAERNQNLADISKYLLGKGWGNNILANPETDALEIVDTNNDNISDAVKESYLVHELSSLLGGKTDIAKDVIKKVCDTSEKLDELYLSWETVYKPFITSYSGKTLNKIQLEAILDNKLTTNIKNKGLPNQIETLTDLVNTTSDTLKHIVDDTEPTSTPSAEPTTPHPRKLTPKQAVIEEILQMYDDYYDATEENKNQFTKIIVDNMIFKRHETPNPAAVSANMEVKPKFLSILNSRYFTKLILDDVLVQLRNAFELPVHKSPARRKIAIDSESDVEGGGLNIAHKRLYIPKGNFERGLLEVRYKKNKHLHPELNGIKMSSNLKSAIYDKLVTGGGMKFSLNPQEKLVFNKLMKKFGKKVDDDYHSDLENKFEVLLGEMNSGNDNSKIKQELRSLLIYMMKTGVMKREHVLDYFLEYAL